MSGSTVTTSLHKIRVRVGRTVRELRHARRWTQAELARELAISQGHLSEIEAGKGSLTAEQFLVLLGLFNVGASQFSPTRADPEVDLQNALARLGAKHLQESAEIVPSEALDDVEEALRAGLASASPRLVPALAPVIVRNVDRINFRKLRAELAAAGLEHRLDWLLENTRLAVETELRHAPPPAWSKSYRRAVVVLGSALDFVGSRVKIDPEIHGPDILDGGIRSKLSLDEARGASSTVSRKFGIVSKLQPAHFAESLKAAREAG